MSNLFDDAQNAAFDIVTNTMGYDASWTPTAGGPAQLARVLLNKPTENRRISENEEYSPHHYTMEYKQGDFASLKDAASENPNKETVTADGVDYLVHSVKAKFDGKNLIATLEPK